MVKRFRPIVSFTVDPGLRDAVRLHAERSGESQSAIVERGMGLALAGRVLAFHGPTCPGCGAESGTAESQAAATGPGLAAGHLRCCAGCGRDWLATPEEMRRAHDADAEWEILTAWPGDPETPEAVEWETALQTMDDVAAETRPYSEGAIDHE